MTEINLYEDEAAASIKGFAGDVWNVCFYSNCDNAGRV